MIFILLFTMVFAATLVVPKLYLNHRLSYTDVPIIINSSANDSTRPSDYFNLPDEYTYLSNSSNSLCTKGTNSLYLCPASIRSAPWKLEDLRREVRFRDPYGKCITVGSHKLDDDSYSVSLEVCSEVDDAQVFILYNDHGNNVPSNISSANVMAVSNEEKDEFKQKYFKYK